MYLIKSPHTLKSVTAIEKKRILIFEKDCLKQKSIKPSLPLTSPRKTVPRSKILAYLTLLKNHLKPSINQYTITLYFRDRTFLIPLLWLGVAPPLQSPRKADNIQNLAPQPSIFDLLHFLHSSPKPILKSRYHHNQACVYPFSYTPKNLKHTHSPLTHLTHF